MRKLSVAVILAVLCLFGGCGKSVIKDLPQDAVKIETASYVNPDNIDDGYNSFEYNGRTYVFYGTQCLTIKENMFKECIGYTDGDTDVRLYSLNGTDSFIAQYNVDGIMEQFVFYRDIGTAGTDIPIPCYIESLDYDIWK